MRAEREINAAHVESLDAARAIADACHARRYQDRRHPLPELPWQAPDDAVAVGADVVSAGEGPRWAEYNRKMNDLLMRGVLA